MLDFTSVEALTFDCYGTLIDWETGLLAALQPVLKAHGIQLSDERVLETYAELEAAAERGPYRPYREVLADVVRGFVREPAPAEVYVLADSLGDWPAFPDTVEALAALKRRFKLGIISNIDDDLFARTARQLRVDFDEVVTAQQARAYKPSLAPFRLALERLRLPPERLVHVAQSLYHDHVPARQLGLRSVWVNRRRGRPGQGATPPAAVAPRPDLEVPDLETLARKLGLLD